MQAELIKAVTETMPTFKGCDVVVFEDSDMVSDPTNLLNADVIIEQDSIDRRIVPDYEMIIEDSVAIDECLQARLSSIHSNMVVEDLSDRVRSGSLNVDLDGDNQPVLMSEFMGRIASMLERHRIKLATEEYVWFTMREDEQGHMFLSWPVSGYMPISASMIFHDLKVQKACTRLKQRHHIKNIRVTGSVVPSETPVYFDWIATE